MARLQRATSINHIVALERAFLQRRVQDVGFPAVHEIPVEARARGIALAEHELPAILHDVGDAVEDFEEHVHERDGVCGRAEAVVDAGHVCHVTIVALV